MARAPFLDKFISGSHQHRGVMHSVEHVVRNLEALLNTKEGFGYFVEGFGLGGYASRQGTHELVEELTREIRGEIERHEPRVRVLDLVLLGRDAEMWLQYDLRCEIEEKPARLRVAFHALSARVTVREQHD